MTKRRNKRGFYHLNEIGMSADDNKNCTCEFCKMAADVYALYGPVSTIYILRNVQISDHQQARIQEIYGLNIVLHNEHTYILAAKWMDPDPTLPAYIKHVTGAEPVTLNCNS